MKNNKKSMNTLRQIIRMYDEGLSRRSISRRLQVSRNTVKRYLVLLEASGFSWKQLLGFEDSALHLLVEPKPDPDTDRYKVLENRFEKMEKELKRVGVTKWLLWEEYRQAEPSGYAYSQFCHHFQQWMAKLGGTMHFEHRAGDKLFVDFAGKKLKYIDPGSGEEKEAEVFIAALGASKLIYVIAVSSQRVEDFLKALSETLEYIGGVTQAVVPDNLKSGVTKADKYEPQLNPSLAEWARYYETTIIPARALAPRDKALVEGAVKITYRQIYAPLRDEVFKGLAALNRGIRPYLEKLNSRPLSKRSYSRWELFGEIEKSVLKPLPAHPFEFKKHIQATVAKNGHIWLGEDKNYYSVPYQHISSKVEVYYNASSVEVFLNYQRVAFHPRDRRPHKYNTQPDHLASHHRFRSEWSAEKFISWAGAIGSHTANFITQLIANKPHEEQAYKSCLGVINLAKKPGIGKDRLELACKKAHEYGQYNYMFVLRILNNKLEAIEDEPQNESQYQLPDHKNIRGNLFNQKKSDSNE